MVPRSGGTRTPPRPGTATPDPGAATRRMLARLVEIQVAALFAGAGLLNAWIDAAARFGERAGRRGIPVLRREPASDPDELRDLCQDLGLEYERCVREMTQLPRIHGLRFYAELQRIREESQPARR